MALLGIDLGTYQARVVVVPPDGEPVASSVITAPAVVAFSKGHVSAGDAAMMAAATLPDVVVPGIKRLLGRSSDDPIVKAACERSGFVAVAHGDDLVVRTSDDDAARFNVSGPEGPARLNVSGPEGPEMTLLTGTTELLRELAEVASGRGDHEAVITVPCWYESKERDVLALAAKSAHIEVRRFIRDAVATGLWMAVAHGDRGRIAVVDVGAGGVSVALVTATESSVRLEASAGSSALGADDVDAELMESVLARASRHERELVRQACHGIKRELLMGDQVSRELVSGNEPKTITIDRWQLDLVLARVASLIHDLCKQALSEAGWQTGDVARAYATGGLSHFRPVTKQVGNSFGVAAQRPPEDSAAPTLGAATQAALLTRKLAGPELDDGERPPRRSSLIPPHKRATSKDNLLTGPVTTKLRKPERFRPQVKVTRKRKSQAPAGTPASEAAAATAVPAAAAVPAIAPGPADAPPSHQPEPRSAPASKELTPVAAAAVRRLSSTPQRFISVPSSENVAPAGNSSGAARMSIPAMASLIPGGEVPGSGQLYRPASARDVLAMPLTGPIGSGDLDPIALPVLLRRVLGGKDVRGHLDLHGGSYELSFDVIDGNAHLGRAEHAKLLRAFDLTEGGWAFALKPGVKGSGDIHPLARVALDGIKRLLRSCPAEDVEAALGELLDLAPQVRPDLESLPKRLGLSGRELRFIDTMLDGKRSGRHAAEHGALGPSTTLQLLALLELYDALLWSDVGKVGVPIETERRLTMKMKALAPVDRADAGGYQRRMTLGMFSGPAGPLGHPHQGSTKPPEEQSK